MKQIIVNSSERPYPIYVGKGIRHQFSYFLKGKNYSQVFVVTDENVSKYYLDDILVSLEKSFVVKSYTVKPGEASKSLTVYEKLQQFLLKENADRHSAIIALGGGVVGDLAGFVASTYMRGISFIQAPTTLLAHDSSVGGKVAINLGKTKNVLGNFYAPDLIVYDTETLFSLPEKEVRSGFAEMVKHGFLSKHHLLDDIRQRMENRIDLTTNNFDDLLIDSIKVKQQIVEQDEKESNIRKYLNLGHTLGHAIEAINSHTHGECVMYGMLFSLYASEQLQGLHGKFLTEDLLQWIKHLNYPIDIISEQDIDLLLKKMTNDKKTVKQHIHFVLLKDVGSPFVQQLKPNEIRQYLIGFMEKMY